MIIIITSQYPLDQADNAGKLYMKVQSDDPLPDILTSRGLYARPRLGVGVHSIEVFECDDANMAEAVRALISQVTIYRNIPGYSYSIEIAYEAPDALKLIGLG